MVFLKWLDPEFCSYAHEAPSAVRARAKKLLDLLRPFANEPIELLQLKALIRSVRQHTANKNVRDVYVAELRSLAGMRWTQSELARIACSLAGGYVYAKDGLSLGVTSANWPAIDCLLRVRDVVLVDNEVGSHNQIRLKFVACNSRYAGVFAEVSFPVDRVGKWAKLFGVHHRRKRIYCSSYKLLAGVHVIGRLERVDNVTQILGVSCTEQLHKQNQSLTLRRFRSQFPCNYGADFDCVSCSVGINQCQYAVSRASTDYPLEVINVGSE